MKKFGIKKTKGNIILLFVIGILIGIIMGLRQPVVAPLAEAETIAVQTPDTPMDEAQGAIKLGAESPVQ